MAFQVIFEDDDFIAVAKPAGVVVHSSRETGDDAISVVSQQIGKPVFAFHRLDKGTSGILLLGKRKVFAGQVTRAFEKKLVRKAYLAVVEGKWDPRVSRVEAKIEKPETGPIFVSENGKPALTTFRLFTSSAQKSFIEALPKTGRTHQIRVHCVHAGHAILGDTMYGKSRGSVSPEQLALHAHSLSFTHPGTKQRLELRSMPSEWLDTWLSGLDVSKAWASLTK